MVARIGWLIVVVCLASCGETHPSEVDASASDASAPDAYVSHPVLRIVEPAEGATLRIPLNTLGRVQAAVTDHDLPVEGAVVGVDVVSSRAYPANTGTITEDCLADDCVTMSADDLVSDSDGTIALDILGHSLSVDLALELVLRDQADAVPIGVEVKVRASDDLLVDFDNQATASIDTVRVLLYDPGTCDAIFTAPLTDASYLPTARGIWPEAQIESDQVIFPSVFDVSAVVVAFAEVEGAVVAYGCNDTARTANADHVATATVTLVDSQ